MKKITSVNLQRRQRSAGWGFEHHRYDGYGFMNISFGNPVEHKWYAFSFTVCYNY